MGGCLVTTMLTMAIIATILVSWNPAGNWWARFARLRNSRLGAQTGALTSCVCQNSMQIVRVSVVGQPRWNVPLPMQYTPDIDVIFTFNEKHEMGVAGQWPRTQAGNV